MAERLEADLRDLGDKMEDPEEFWRREVTELWTDHQKMDLDLQELGMKNLSRIKKAGWQLFKFNFTPFNQLA